MSRNTYASYEASDNRRKSLAVQTAWTYLAATRNTTYATGGTSYSMYNPYLMLCTCSFNINMSVLPSASGAILLTGLPIPLQNQHVSLASQSNRSIRGYVSTAGKLVVDVAPSSVGWYAGTVTYVYSSLP